MEPENPRFRDEGLKIGLSQDVNDRLKTGNTWSRRRLHVGHEVECVDRAAARTLELEAHTILRSVRLNGEWFNTDLRDAIAAIEKAIDRIGGDWYAQRPAYRLRLWSRERLDETRRAIIWARNTLAVIGLTTLIALVVSLTTGGGGAADLLQGLETAPAGRAGYVMATEYGIDAKVGIPVGGPLLSANYDTQGGSDG